jgi:hypothetical protein
MLIFLQGSWQSGDRFHVPFTLFLAHSGRLTELVAASAPKGGLRRAISFEPTAIKVRIYYSRRLEGSLDEAEDISAYYKAWGFAAHVEMCELELPPSDGDQQSLFTAMKKELQSLISKDNPFPYTELRANQPASVKNAFRRLGELLGSKESRADVTCAPTLNAACLMLGEDSRLSLSAELYHHLETQIPEPRPSLVSCAELMIGTSELRNVLSQARLVMLWGRRSGKRRTPGPHPEHTSGAKALNQMAARLQDLAPVVRVGDGVTDPDGRSGHSKHVENAHLKEKQYSALLTCLDMTEIHRESSFCEGGAGKLYGKHNKLVLQLWMYASMSKDKGGKVVHIGLRSGMLIALAYLGVSVVYLEERGNPTRKKWEAFQGKLKNLVRCQLTALPSSIGRRVQVLEELGLADNSNAYTYFLEQRFIATAIECEVWPEDEFDELFGRLTKSLRSTGRALGDKSTRIRADYAALLKIKVREKKRKKENENEKEKEPETRVEREKEKQRETDSGNDDEAVPSSVESELPGTLTTSDVDRLYEMTKKWLRHPGFDQSSSWGYSSTDTPVQAVPVDPSKHNAILYYLVTRDAQYRP